MKTQNADDSDDEFELNASLHSFEQLLRQQQPQPVEIDLAQPLHRVNRLSSKSVVMSPLSLALSCGGSALAGAAAVLLAVLLWDDDQSKDHAFDSEVKSASAIKFQQTNPSLETKPASSNAIDVFSGNVTAGILISHPELARLAWTSEAITRVSPSEISSDSATWLNTPESRMENRNTLFLLKREIQL